MQKNNQIFVLNQEEVMAIVGARHGDPHHILGMHVCLSDLYVNAFLPDASAVSVVSEEDKTEYPMHAEYADGFFTVCIREKAPFPYQLKIVRSVWSEDGTETEAVEWKKDAYNFPYSVPIEQVMQVVNDEDSVQNGFRAKEVFGARKLTLSGTDGVGFCMELPGCVRASVVGDFNHWDGRIHPMRKIDYTDLFELFLPFDITGARYKFEVLYENGATDIFSDPYATAFEPVPGNASLFTEPAYDWTDAEYMKKRKQKNQAKSPVNIYEVHMQTFDQTEDGAPLSYRAFGKKIASYAKNMKYNYIELMPLMEYAKEDTWGYNTTGIYAPTSRFGTPADFMAMVDGLHAKGIGVIMDMVPVMDADCMAYWLSTYHLDGIRLDSREQIEAFRRDLGTEYPDVIYDCTWNIKGVKTLENFMRESPDRRGDFVEYISETTGFLSDRKEILALSHDLVAYGQGSFIEKMPGGYEDKYADLRTFYGLMMSLPGKKLMFMGQEFGMFGGFDGCRKVDWSVLEFDANKFLQKYVKDLNALYLEESAFYEETATIVFADEQPAHTVCFRRMTEESTCYVVCNFGTADKKDYRIETETPGTYKEIFSSDAAKYGGEGKNNKQQKTSKDGSIEIFLPALSIAVIKKVK